MSRKVQEWFVPFAADHVIDFDLWLDQTPYTCARKEELRKVREEISNPLDPKNFNVKSFGKDESYTPGYKYPRPINSRDDRAKVLLGPVFKAIETVVFKLHWFIKKIPMIDRPAYIQEHVYVPNGHYIATDYTAFEALFVKKLMQSCEMVLYEHMMQYHPQKEDFLNILKAYLMGKNHCIFKYFTVDVEATRMSGEMNTSLGNGFSNLMIMLYILEKLGSTEIRGVVEGDDGLFWFNGPVPTSEHFKDMGLVVKMEVHEKINTASFCGIVYAEGDYNVITNPIDEILNFGYCSGKYANANSKTLLSLLRAKSLSMIYQYPGCPILNALARYGLRVSHGARVNHLLEKEGVMSLWEKEQLKEALDFVRCNGKHILFQRSIGWNSRLLVEKLYGISIDHQIDIEQYFDSLVDVQALDIPLLDLYTHFDQVDYFYRYQSVAGDWDRPSLFASEEHEYRLIVNL